MCAMTTRIKTKDGCKITISGPMDRVLQLVSEVTGICSRSDTTANTQFLINGLEPGARDRAYAAWLPFCDRDNLNHSYTSFLKSCDTYEWKFFADGSAVKETN